MRHTLLTTLFGVSSLIGCQHTQSNKPLPAIIEHSTPSIKAEIQQTIETNYGGISPLLSNSVFMTSHEHSLHYGLSSTAIDKPSSKQTQYFLLQKRAIDCVLFHPQSNAMCCLKQFLV
jgi:hypothetical protein